MRVLVAVLMGLGILVVLLGSLRSLSAHSPANAPYSEPSDPPEGVRITYWCEECGTEMLLVRKGSESAPRHCGEAMIRREEPI